MNLKSKRLFKKVSSLESRIDPGGEEPDFFGVKEFDCEEESQKFWEKWSRENEGRKFKGKNFFLV